MAKKEKGAMFAQNSDLIEEHLKAAFKAATDANLALREEVNVLKKNLAADTERSHAVDHDIMRAQDDQRDLTRRLKELCDVQMREIYDANKRLREERDTMKTQRVTEAAELKQAKDALEAFRKQWEEEKALEEARIAKLDDEVRQAEERWQSVQKKLSGKELERALAAGKQEAP